MGELPVDAAQECVPPKLEPPKIEEVIVEDVTHEDDDEEGETLPPLIQRGYDSDSSNDEDEEDDDEPRGSHINNEGLRQTTRKRVPRQHIQVTGKGKTYVSRPIVAEGAPLDDYRSFLEDGVINVNLHDAESHKMTETEIHLHVLHTVLV